MIAVLISLILVITSTTPTLSVKAKEKTDNLTTGITLDCARHYYLPEEIEQYIDLLGKTPHHFLQLHLTDNQNVGIECDYLGQTPEAATENADGSFTADATGKKFLSSDQIEELLSYAKEKGVTIVPEIDTPAHMDGFFSLVKKAKGKKFLKKIKKSGYDGELNLENETAFSFAKNIYSEYADVFAGCPFFHMGCDEMDSGSDAEKMGYITGISHFLEKKGFTVRIWNDFLTKKDIKQLPSKIQVTYWSYDGDTEDKAEKAARRKKRASLSDLTAQNIQVLNYNSYYLYYVPSLSDTEKDSAYRISDLEENWNPWKWDGENQTGVKDAQNVIGTAVSVWGEDAKGVDNATIYKQTALLYEAMEKCQKGIEKTAAAYIRSQQITGGTMNGAIRMTSDGIIVPYFANFACLGLETKKSQKNEEAVAAYIHWYVTHMNTSETDKNGLDGTIYDYCADGTETDANGTKTADYDSTDSYAATFLMVLQNDKSNGGKNADLTEELLNRLVGAMMGTYNQKLGLTETKPGYGAYYLMDNCEVYRGLMAAASLYQERFSNTPKSRQMKKKAESLKKAICRQFWDKKQNCFLVAIDQNQKSLFKKACTTFYPQAANQLYPVIYGVISPKSRMAKEAYGQFKSQYMQHGKKGHDWTCGDTSDEYPWCILLRGVEKMDDQKNGTRFFSYLQAQYSGNTNQEGWYCGEAGQLLISIHEASQN